MFVCRLYTSTFREMGKAKPSPKSVSKSRSFQPKAVGRKKSNPVWLFFNDLRDEGSPSSSKGGGSIQCLHCDFSSDDRSTFVMKYHIKRQHNADPKDLWSQLESMYALQTNGDAPEVPVESPTTSSTVEAPNNCAPRTRKGRTSSGSAKSAMSMETSDGIEATNSEPHDLPTTAVSEPCASTLSHGTGTTDDPQEPLKTNESPHTPTTSENLFVEPIRPTNSNVWTHLGRFDTEEEMRVVRTKEKVSKRRTEHLKNGVKVRYRCNRWKRTKCAYQMYAWYANSKIDLYESGEHDHSGGRMIIHMMKMQNPTMAGGALPPQLNIATNKKRLLSQEDILNSLLLQAMERDQEEQTEFVHQEEDIKDEPFPKAMDCDDEQNPTAQLLRLADATCGYALPLPQFNETTSAMTSILSAPFPFSLTEEHCQKQLSQLAEELNLSVSFNCKRTNTIQCHFRCPKSACLEDKSLLFVEDRERGQQIIVTDLNCQLVVSEEVWIKGDCAQFLWAVRGKCCHYFPV